MSTRRPWRGAVDDRGRGRGHDLGRGLKCAWNRRLSLLGWSSRGHFGGECPGLGGWRTRCGGGGDCAPRATRIGCGGRRDFGGDGWTRGTAAGGDGQCLGQRRSPQQRRPLRPLEVGARIEPRRTGTGAAVRATTPTTAEGSRRRSRVLLLTGPPCRTGRQATGAKGGARGESEVSGERRSQSNHATTAAGNKAATRPSPIGGVGAGSSLSSHRLASTGAGAGGLLELSRC